MGAFSWYIGSLELATVCEDVRIASEGGVGWNDPGEQIPGRPGVAYDPEAPLLPLEIQLRTIIKGTSGSDQLEHFHQIKAALSGRGYATLKRTLPYVGTVRALCKLVGQVQHVEDRSIYHWPLSIPSGSWQDDTESEVTYPTNVVTSGSVEIHDPVMVIDAAGTTTITEADGTELEIVAGSGPTYPVTVTPDAGNRSGTIVDDNGDDASGSVTFSHPAWLRFQPGVTVSISSTTTPTFKWRNRWGN